MNRPAREIPGYYFDSEKRKYFKIQPSHTAPSSSAYSASDVKRRKIRDAATENEKVLSLRQKGRIRRAKILEDPLLGGKLARDHGRQFALDAPSIYADGLVPQGVLPSLTQFGASSDPFFDLEHRTDLGDGLVDIRMVFDDQLFTVRSNVDKYHRSEAHGSIEQCHRVPVSRVNQGTWRLERFGHPGESTSLSSHQETRTLAFTWLSGTNHSGIAIAPMSGIPTDSDTDRPTILLTPGGLGDINVWTSASAPPSSDDLFAFGTTHGIITVDKERCDPRTICPTLGGDWMNSPTDVFALEYLSDNPSILLSGSRSGILNIIDLRLPFSGHDRITHPSTITHIRQLDSHRLLVAGLSSTLCQYDLRFRKVNIPSLSTPDNNNNNHNNATYQKFQKRKKTHSHAPVTKSITRPILTYLEFKNSATMRLGLDIDLETGLIAAAQEPDDATSMVELFSLHGGHKVQSRVARACWREPHGDGAVMKSKCVKWLQDGPGKGKSLWVGAGKDLRRFAWATWEDGEEDFEG